MVMAAKAKRTEDRVRADNSRSEWSALILSLIINDAVMVGLAFRIAYWVRFETGLPVFEEIALSSRAYYEGLVIVMIPLWLVIFGLTGLYQRSAARKSTLKSFGRRRRVCWL